GKLQFVVAVTDDLIEKGSITADRLVKRLGKIAGGGGGGKKHMAQLGTKDPGNEDTVFKSLPDVVRDLVSG
ncbi:MAG: hypothetical protein JSV33_06270, partial [bacterium]